MHLQRRGRVLPAIVAALALVAVGGLAWMTARDEPSAATKRTAAAAEAARPDIKPAPLSPPTRSERVEEASPEPEQHDPAPIAQPCTGRVVVVATTDGGEPVEGVRVSLRGRSSPSALSDERGRAEFHNVAIGQYWVEIDPESLPPGVLPPIRQHVRANTEMPGAYRTDVDVTPAALEQEVRIQLWRAGRIDGYVLGPAGEPVEAALVAAQSTIDSGQSVRGFSADDGYYALEAPPGIYWMQVFTDPNDTPPGPGGVRYEDLGPPPPLPFELGPNQAVRLNLVLGGGACFVTGRVVDERGDPFVGLSVLAYYRNEPDDGLPRMTWGNRAGQDVTDSNGEYTLQGLYSAPIAIQVAPEGYLPRTPIGSNQLARPVDTIELDLRTESEARAPERVALRSRPFHVTGRIELDPTWAKRHAVEPDDLTMSIGRPLRWQEPSDDPRAPQRVFSDLDIAKDGSYAWACETPSEAVVVRVVSNHGPSVELRIDPVPDTSIVVPIPFP
jgi:hypothetical protein